MCFSFSFHLSNVLIFVSYEQHEPRLKSNLTMILILIGVELLKIFERPQIYVGKHSRLYSEGTMNSLARKTLE